MILLLTLLNTLAVTLWYLSLGNQCWRARPLPARPFRGLAAVLLLADTLIWMWHYSAAGGLFASLTMAMLVSGALPYVPLLIPAHHDNR